MPSPNYPEIIIGTLPRPEDEIVAGNLPSDLPDEIIGTLPPPAALAASHRIANTDFSPDGVTIRCSCGWQEGPLTDNNAAQERFLIHLPE